MGPKQKQKKGVMTNGKAVERGGMRKWRERKGRERQDEEMERGERKREVG